MKTSHVLNAGIDTLYLNVYYADPETYRRLDIPLDDDLQARFNDLQQQAKSTRQDVETPWTLDRKPLSMLSHGTGKLWHWILHNDDLNVQIGLGDYRGLIAHVRVSAQYLWRVRALPNILGCLNYCLNRLFAHEMYLAPSEIDLCVDVANWPMSALDRSCFVAKARKSKVRFDEASLLVGAVEVEYSGPKQDTFYIGKRTSPIHAKVYDKLKEIKDHHNEKAWYLDILKAHGGWDGEEPVTRVELTTKREALKDLEIETGHDLMRHLKDLWAYLVGTDEHEGWIRYAVPQPNDVNRSRWPAHPTWNAIKHAFDAISEQPASALIRTRKQQVNLDAATASIAGYLSSRTVWQCERDGVPIDKMALETAVADIYEEIEKLLQDKGVSFQQLLQAKQRRYYLREEKTRAVTMKHAKSVFSNEPEPI